MLLTVDIGNTNITAGVFKNGRLKYQFDIPTREFRQYQLSKEIRSCGQVSASIVCSVVPKLTPVIYRQLKLVTGKTPYIIGKDLIVPIKNLYRFPRQVGQDRLVNAYAAIKLYSAPLIVIDSGTAITFDVISKQPAYLGGLIFPGMSMSLAALNEKTALLPKVKLTLPQTLVGRDTKNSMLSGVVFGTAALTQGLVARIRLGLGSNIRIIGTGGNIALIKKYSGMKITVNRNLTLTGLHLLYRDSFLSPES